MEATWIPVNEPPPTSQGGSFQCIGAWRNAKGKWYTGEVWYLNGVQLENLDGGEEEYLYPVGFHRMEDRDGDERFDPIGILFWTNMPAPPGFCEHNVIDGDCCSACNKEYKLARMASEA